jgi:hypothetical protein
MSALPSTTSCTPTSDGMKDQFALLLGWLSFSNQRRVSRQQQRSSSTKSSSRYDVYHTLVGISRTVQSAVATEADCTTPPLLGPSIFPV